MNKTTLYYYPPCSSCKKAVKWLNEMSVPVSLKHIVEETPDAEALKAIVQRSGLPVKKFFNTSGKKYRELKLKDKLPGLTLDEALSLLSGDGMLIKRPLLVRGNTVLAGFREEDWAAELL